MVIFNSYMLIYQRVQVSNGNSPILVHPVGILLNSMFFGFLKHGRVTAISPTLAIWLLVKTLAPFVHPKS